MCALPKGIHPSLSAISTGGVSREGMHARVLLVGWFAVQSILFVCQGQVAEPGYTSMTSYTVTCMQAEDKTGP